jgi:hypothetical protein
MTLHFAYLLCAVCDVGWASSVGAKRVDGVKPPMAVFAPPLPAAPSAASLNPLRAAPMARPSSAAATPATLTSRLELGARLETVAAENSPAAAGAAFERFWDRGGALDEKIGSAVDAALAESSHSSALSLLRFQRSRAFALRWAGKLRDGATERIKKRAARRLAGVARRDDDPIAQLVAVHALALEVSRPRAVSAPTVKQALSAVALDVKRKVAQALALDAFLSLAVAAPDMEASADAITRAAAIGAFTRSPEIRQRARFGLEALASSLETSKEPAAARQFDNLVEALRIMSYPDVRRYASLPPESVPPREPIAGAVPLDPNPPYYPRPRAGGSAGSAILIGAVLGVVPGLIAYAASRPKSR